VGTPPLRPDAPTTAHRVDAPDIRPLLVWLIVAGTVGALALWVIVNVHTRGTGPPPSSMFAAAGVLMSFIAIVTVGVAARRSGATFRAALALGGAFAAIAITKFALGPYAFTQHLDTTAFQDPLGIGSRGAVWAIGAVVGLLYAGVILLLAGLLRPTGSRSPRASTGVVLIVIGIGATLVGAIVTDAPMAYLGFALTGLEATGIAVALFVAASLLAVAFRDTATQAKVVGTTSAYVSIVWVAIAFLLVFQLLWVVFLLAIVTIWPVRTVTPK
jgi:hypothetical protein